MKSPLILSFLLSVFGLAAQTDSLQQVLQKSRGIKRLPVLEALTEQLRNSNPKGAEFYAVCDEGPGFSDEDRKSLYQKFKRLSARPTGGEPSTGLGLAIVKHLVDQVGGKIYLTSKPGAGSEFKIGLPVGRNEEIQANTPSSFHPY